MARFTRNRGEKRLRRRDAGARFQKATLENTFGLRAPVCPHCRGFNPIGVGEPVPERCKQCGKEVADSEWV